MVYQKKYIQYVQSYKMLTHVHPLQVVESVYGFQVDNDKRNLHI
jgi:hypothetical protein